MYRNLKNVIAQILIEIPYSEFKLREALHRIYEDANYYAPESPTGWIKISDALQAHTAYPRWANDKMWKFKVCSIVSTVSIEDMKKELKDYPELKD